MTNSTERFALLSVSFWLSCLAAWRWPLAHIGAGPIVSWGVHAILYWPFFFLAVFGVYLLCSKTARGGTESKNVGYIPRLDHLRFFAAALVVLYHYYGGVINVRATNPFLVVLQTGSSGVDLFFVLSGFIFGVIGYGKKIRYFDYIFSRVVRIYPLYIFAILLVIGQNPELSGGQFVLLLFPIFDVGIMPGLRGFGQLWTIGVEFQFYLIFPFLVGFIARNGRRFLVGLAVLFLLLRAHYYAETGTISSFGQWTLLGRMDEFSAGILAAYLYVAGRGRFASVFHLIASAGLVFVCMQWLGHWGGYLYGAHSPVWIVWPIVEGVSWAYFVLSYLSCTIAIPASIDRALARMGELSFSIYVMHTYAVYWTLHYVDRYHLTGRLDMDAALVGIFVCLPLACCLAFLTYHLIEKQFFVFRRKYVEPVETAGIPATSAGLQTRPFWQAGAIVASVAAIGLAAIVATGGKSTFKAFRPKQSPIQPMDQLAPDLPLLDPQVSIQGYWKLGSVSDRAPLLPLAGSVYGSWQGDEATGTLVLGPISVPPEHYLLGIPLLVGPSTAGLSLVVKDSADQTIIAQLPLAGIAQHTWVLAVADVSDVPAGHSIVIQATDNGVGWGQWFAVGSPRWLK